MRSERRLIGPLLRILSASLWRAVGRPFDRRLGTDTEAVRWPGEMQVVGPNAAQGCEYTASPARTFWLSAGSLRIEASRFTFVDIGSGKGRVLLLAAALPFRRIEGVEFASDLNAVAARNIARAVPDAAGRARFTLQTCDALDYAIPDGPCVVYLYNPFGAALVEALADNLMRAHRAAPREIYVVYVNPRHRAAFERLPFEPVEGAWYMKPFDARVPYGFAIYRLHGEVNGAQAASAT